MPAQSDVVDSAIRVRQIFAGPIRLQEQSSRGVDSNGGKLELTRLHRERGV